MDNTSVLTFRVYIGTGKAPKIFRAGGKAFVTGTTGFSESGISGLEFHQGLGLIQDRVHHRKDIVDIFRRNGHGRPDL